MLNTKINNNHCETADHNV